MIAELPDEHSTHIRKMDALRDLNQIADLVEMCFPIHLDPDGQVYVQKMRKTARQMHLMGWLSPLAELSDLTASGFVWEQDGRIIGNLSLIPFQQQGQQIHLIANVAVHPAYRQQGIGRALTRRALSYLRRRNEPRTWLQVREDNLAAQALYRSVGFTDQLVRTTWRIRPKEMTPVKLPTFSDLQVCKRRAVDWPKQQDWLAETYPPLMRWNLPLDFSRLAPSGLLPVSNFLDGIHLRQWTVARDGMLQGVITWQKTTTYTHNLWLAMDPAAEVRALPFALQQVLQQRSKTHPLSVDYPHDRHPEIFEQLGFSKFRTLVWMRCSLK